MPELPEVETVKNSLKELVIGKTINEIIINYGRIIQTDRTEFQTKLVGQTIIDIKRKGKYLIFIFSKYLMVSHLRMEGKYFLKAEDEEVSKHDHIIFKFTDHTELRYNDTRKFGVMYLYPQMELEKLYQMDPLNKLGLEPFDEGFTLDYLKEKFKNNHRPIKTTLLDQSIISGLGNIYADEVVFMAKLNPNDDTSDLSDEDIANIITSSKEVLQKAINLGGTTIRSFVNSHAATGLFQNELLVHTKENCPCCGLKIKKIFVGGRGTYFCPHCQKKKKTVVAITGSIATGKSTISALVSQEGYKVIDLDRISHQVLKKNTIGYQKVVDAFSSDILDENGEINRKLLGQIIFSDKDKKQTLEAITHPLILKKMDSEIKKCSDSLIFCDVPLLFENGLEKDFDYILLAYSDQKTQLKRLIERDGIDEDYANKKINSQINIDKKRDLSDFVVDNSKTIEYTKLKVKEILEILKGV